MSSTESKIKNLPDTYRGPEKWMNAANEASSWGMLTSIPAAIYVLKPFFSLAKQHIDNPHLTVDVVERVAEKSRKRLNVSTALVAAVSVVAGYFGYRKAETAENDYNTAISAAKDLSLENEKLKIDKKWADREQERRLETNKAESKSL